MRLSTEKTVLYPGLAVFYFCLGILSLYDLFSGIPPWVAVSNYLHHNLEMAVAVCRETGISQKEINVLTRSLDNIVHMLVRVTPVWVLVTTIFIA